MKGEIWPPQCYICSKLISYKDLEMAFSWISFGGCQDDEPPDPEYAHEKCWVKADANTTDLVERTSWVPPHQYER